MSKRKAATKPERNLGGRKAEFQDGRMETKSFRLPASLMGDLGKIATKRDQTPTDVVRTELIQAVERVRAAGEIE